LDSSTNNEIVEWLTSIGLAQYAPVFVENEMSWPDLLKLDHATLKDDLGIKPLGHRNRLLEAVAQCKGVAPEASPTRQQGTSIVMPDLQRPLNLFISYGRDDFKGEAAALADALTQRGHQVWFDRRELCEGWQWEHDIEQGLRKSDWVILLMTPHSVRRPDGFCLKEITKAAELKRKIVPVLIHDVPGGAPLLICNVQYLDWRDAVPSSQFADRFQQYLVRLCAAVEQGRLDFEGRQGSLHHYLKPLDFMRDQVERASGFIGREWLLQEVDRWLVKDGSRVFWLSGGPGVGKSAFAAHLCQLRPEVNARHFCMHNHAERGDPRRALLSIIYQLSQQLPEYADRLYGSDLTEETSETKDTSTIFDNLLVRLLDTVPVPASPCVVVIDAIDEASREGRNEIAAMIRDHWCRTPSWLRLLITSRPEPELLSMLAELRPWVLDAQREENLQDIRQFLHGELVRLGLETQQTHIDAIVERSEGVFLYVKKLLEDIAQGHLSLDRIEEFPSGMAGMYSRFFDRKFGSRIEQYQRQWRAALRVMLAAREPLPVAVLKRALGWSEEVFNDLVLAFGSLLVCQGTGDERVILPFHKSLPDWLTNAQAAGAYFVSEEDGHESLASLWRLWDPERQDGFAALGYHAETYVLKHLFEHMRMAGMRRDRETLLCNFWFAMRRCEAGVLEYLLDDYRHDLRGHSASQLRAWSEWIIGASHLLRRGRPRWPVANVLMQAALEHGRKSPVSKAAEQCLDSYFDKNTHGSKMIVHRNGPSGDASGRGGARLSVIELGLDTWSEEYEPIVLGEGHVLLREGDRILIVDVLRGTVKKMESGSCTGCVRVDEKLFATGDSDGRVVVFDVSSGGVRFEAALDGSTRDGIRFSGTASPGINTGTSEIDAESIGFGKVMVVTAKRELGELLSEILEDEGYYAVIASSRRQARAIHGKEALGLVLLDEDLPGGDGLALVSEWSGLDNSSAPIIVLSGKGSGIDLVDFMGAGAYGLLRRPFKHFELLEMIRRAYAQGQGHLPQEGKGISLTSANALECNEIEFIGKIGNGVIAASTNAKFALYDVYSGVEIVRCRVSSSVDGVAFNGDDLVFFWQCDQACPALLNCRDGSSFPVVTEFELANLDGAFFMGRETVVFWAEDDVCFYHVPTKSSNYTSFLKSIEDQEEFMGVRQHPHAPEVLLWSNRRILRYGLGGRLIGEVAPSVEFHRFMVRSDGRFVVWNSDLSDEGVWQSSIQPGAAHGISTQGCQLLDFDDSGNLLVDVDGKDVIAVGLPVMVEVVRQLGDRKVVAIESGGSISIWGLKELIEGDSSGRVSSGIFRPSLVRAGRLTYVDSENNLCILELNRCVPEYILYGFASRPDDLVIGKEQIALMSGTRVFLYGFKGNLLRRFDVGRFMGALPAVPGKIVTWDTRKIQVWNAKDGKPRHFMGVEDHLDDDPIGGVAVSFCGSVVVAWNRVGEIYAWRIDRLDAPVAIGSEPKLTKAVCAQAGEVLYVGFQTQDGSVLVKDSTHNLTLASRVFSGEEIERLEVAEGCICIEFTSGAKWRLDSGDVVLPARKPLVETLRQQVIYEEPCDSDDGILERAATTAVWHCDYDVDWAVPVGEDEIFVASRNGVGEVLQVLRART